jgi:hypothetical protein
MSSDQDDDKYEVYIAHDSIGVSHIIRVLKDKPPQQVKRVGCDA